MLKLRKLPDAEYEIMRAVWRCKGEITSATVSENLLNGKKWKIQTILTLMGRLVERGFLGTEKNSKERKYFCLISEEEYLSFETEEFILRFHNDSFFSLASTLYKSKKLQDADISKFKEWIDAQK